MVKDIITEHRRLKTLEILYEQADFRLNENVLLDELNAYSFNLSADSLKTELAWLAEQGLIIQDQIGNLIVAELTDRGSHAALGRIITPGVKRPRPRRG